MRPYIICHMVESVDGRIDCDMVDKISGDEYYSTLNSLDCPSRLEGKYSYQLHQCGFEDFKVENPIPFDKETFYKSEENIPAKKEGYEISVDTTGTLLWDKVDNKNRLCILSEKVSRQYLEYIRELKISYIVTGRDNINLHRAMEILYKEFEVNRLAVVGGGRINWAFLNERLIDELSLLLAPGIDGRNGQPALFDGIPDKEFRPKSLILQNIEKFDNGVIWIRYKV